MSDPATTILIVDDEPDMVAYLEALLDDHGYNVHTAQDGGAGLRAVRERTPDLVLMDVKMPGQSGLHLYRSMQQDPELRGIPVIVITGMAEFDLFGGSGCDRLPEPAARLHKPVDRDLLLGAIARALGKEKA